MSYRTAVFRLVAALGCGLLPSSIAAAQSTTPSGEIRGRVVHAGSTVPIPSATVDVTSGTGGGSPARVTTVADGNFHVTALRAGRYRVMVRALGFAPKTLPVVELSAAHPAVDVGVIALTAAVVQLQE